jgi:hypothetical protein
MSAKIFLIALLIGLIATPASAQAQECQVMNQKTKEAIPGVFLTWDSAFLCPDAPDSGEYTVTINITNSETSVESVTINDLFLSHTTPRPRRQAPKATAEANGLPLTIAPGETLSFTVSGTYEMVRTGAGMKANLHLRAKGFGDTSGVPFRLGINVMIRGVSPDS